MDCRQGKVEYKKREAPVDGPEAAEEGQKNPDGATDCTTEMTVEFEDTGIRRVSIKYPEDDEKFKARTATQNVEHVMDEIVSKFIVATCRTFPKPETDALPSVREVFSDPEQFYPIACGSTAEFYIQPLHSCIDDADFFKVRTYRLAFSDEKPVIPNDVRYITDTTDCFFAEPYRDYPSFVKLLHLGHMRYNWKHKIFEFIPVKIRELVECDFQKKSHNLNLDESFPSKDFRDVIDFVQTQPCISSSGPAMKLLGDSSIDAVESIWCPQWPTEAKCWPNRRRKYGWPTTANIRKIVRNGCHVVFAKHPACRYDIHQCRLSFSVALLQSWTPVQQIVYHLLRFLAKRELIRKDCPKEDEVICTYHFKTLMMWSCEEMSPEWWNSYSVVAICCYLLRKLSHWLMKKTCPNYFIPRANLFHEQMNQKIVNETTERLIAFSHFGILCPWLVDHYMWPIFDVSVSTKTFEVSKCADRYIFDTRKTLASAKLRDIDQYLSLRFFYAFQHFCNVARKELSGTGPFTFAKPQLRIFTSGLCQMNKLMPSAVIEPCFEFLASVIIILLVGHLIDCRKEQYVTEWLIDVVRQVLIKPKLVSCRHHNFPKIWKTVLNRSQFYFIIATDLMDNLTGSNDDPELKIVSQISKYLIILAYMYKDYRTSAFASATLTYMAALHFAASEYQTAVDLCSTVLISQTTTEGENETLNAACLFFIDDIARIVGLYLLFRQIKDNLQFIRKQFLLDLRLTPEVFAQYLIISSNERTQKPLGLNYNFRTPKFLLDEILATKTNRTISRISRKAGSVLRVYQRAVKIDEIDAGLKYSVPKLENIIQLFTEYSLEHFTSFYIAMCKDLGIQCGTIDCYRAAYLYKCHKISEVLHLCERILHNHDLQSDLREFAFANVMVIPPLDSYFDTDIQCLLGLHTLVHYLSPFNEDLAKIEETSGCSPTFEQFFARKIFSETCVLSAVLTYAYSTKCQYFLGRHFLARYLKLRCVIDRCHSLSETMFEFKQLKASLPFEQIIVYFLQQRLRKFQEDVN